MNALARWVVQLVGLVGFAVALAGVAQWSRPAAQLIGGGAVVWWAIRKSDDGSPA